MTARATYGDQVRLIYVCALPVIHANGRSGGNPSGGSSIGTNQEPLTTIEAWAAPKDHFRVAAIGHFPYEKDPISSLHEFVPAPTWQIYYICN